MNLLLLLPNFPTFIVTVKRSRMSRKFLPLKDEPKVIGMCLFRSRQSPGIRFTEHLLRPLECALRALFTPVWMTARSDTTVRMMARTVRMVTRTVVSGFLTRASMGKVIIMTK